MENCVLPKYISNDNKKNFSPETKRYYKQKKYNLSNSKKRTTLLHLTALKIGFFVKWSMEPKIIRTKNCVAYSKFYFV